MPEKTLLLIDSIINLALGILLGVFPEKIIAVIGIPHAPNPFYASVLGGVLFGIGVALLLEISKERTGFGGLGLGGAIAINVCGGFVLMLWLIFGNLAIPIHGRIIMWSLVALLFIISIAELAIGRKTK
ncbi:MAG: hypothetical protein MJA83_18250 [Gammaproteobacteria bacterium]|nr:hypothetical protein [Gammaproteobacteria bacterium]